MDIGTIVALVIGALTLVMVPTVAIVVYYLISKQLRRMEGVWMASVPTSQGRLPATIAPQPDVQYDVEQKYQQVPPSQGRLRAMMSSHSDIQYDVEQKHQQGPVAPVVSAYANDQHSREEQKYPQGSVSTTYRTNYSNTERDARQIRSQGIANPKQKTLRQANHVFTYAEIVDMTNNFRKRIGKGRSAVVFHGRLNDGHEVAVKVLDESFPQGAKEFASEVQILLTVHHKCIAGFFGYCNEGQSLILLYEYLKGGTLRELLSGKCNKSALLTWEKRLQIAECVAEGLDYLHSSCQRPIIHRDVKTANILLNEHLEPKISDFGLCKEGFEEDVAYVSTVVAGTPGYIDPEYFLTGRLTKKSDVYSLGVVLLELISGHSAFFIGPDGHHCNLVLWAQPLLEGKDLESVADPNLREQYNVDSMWKVAYTAMACTAEESNKRPTMTDVVKQLQDALEVQTRQGAAALASIAESAAISPPSTGPSTGSALKEFLPKLTSSMGPSTGSAFKGLSLASTSSVGYSGSPYESPAR